jgi:hypothetical protein
LANPGEVKTLELKRSVAKRVSEAKQRLSDANEPVFAEPLKPLYYLHDQAVYSYPTKSQKRIFTPKSEISEGEAARLLHRNPSTTRVDISDARKFLAGELSHQNPLLECRRVAASKWETLYQVGSGTRQGSVRSLRFPHLCSQILEIGMVSERDRYFVRRKPQPRRKKSGPDVYTLQSRKRGSLDKTKRGRLVRDPSSSGQSAENGVETRTERKNNAKITQPRES